MEEKLKLMETMDIYLPDVDGVINCMHNYCLNLYDKTDLTVVVPQNTKKHVDKMPYKINRCKSMYLPILRVYYGLPKNDLKLKKLLDEKEFDIIHVHSPFGMAKFALNFAKKKNIPIVATFHTNMRMIFDDITKSKKISDLVVKKMGKRYNQFDEIFVCSPLVEKQLRSYGYTGKVTYLPFGTDFKLVENVDEKAKEANKKLGISENDLIFSYVGRIQKLKRIDFILKSLKIVKDNGYKFKFFVVGKGKELEKLKRLAKKLGLDKEVIFTGFLARELFPLVLARTDLLLFPSLYDNFGLVKVEFASYSKPGVFIKNSCAGDGIVDGKNGYLSDDNENSFAEKIVEAIQDREKLKKVGKNAQKDIYVTWQECSELLLEKLKEIVNKRRKQNDNKK